MTTSTTPAAAVSRAYADWLDAEKRKTFPAEYPPERLAGWGAGFDAYRRAGWDGAIAFCAAREYALVAERDQLQLDLRRLMDKHNALHVNAHAVRAVAIGLLSACRTAFDQTCSVGRAKDWAQLRAAIDEARQCAALAAPAVEGV